MKLDAEIQTELGAIASRCGCELLHADFRGGVLQLVLDKEGGVNIAECSSVSREASAFLDVVDFGSGNYTLEVTSPGLDREFYSEGDYERFLGSRVKVSWMDQGKKRTDVAQLRGYDREAQSGPQLELEFTDGVRLVELSDVLKTRLDPEF
ncbi:MAG: ribosome maturation factor RimP [Thermoanaerobaculia bacterium]